MKRGGRTKLTQSTGDAILASLRVGCFRREACAAAGIAPRTFRNWEARAAAGEQPYADFLAEVEVAESTAILALHGAIYAAGRGLAVWRSPDGSVRAVGDWRASARMLEALEVATFARVAARRRRLDDRASAEARAAAARVRAVFASRT